MIVINNIAKYHAEDCVINYPEVIVQKREQRGTSIHYNVFLEYAGKDALENNRRLVCLAIATKLWEIRGKITYDITFHFDSDTQGFDNGIDVKALALVTQEFQSQFLADNAGAEIESPIRGL